MHLLGLLTFTNFVSTAGYSAVFVLSLLQSCCVPTSSELTLGFAGAVAAQGRLSLAGVILAGVFGEVAGAYIAWAVGRHAGRAAVDRFGRYVLLTHRDLDRAEAWYHRHQRFGVFGSRLLPVIRNFVAVPAGIAEVPLARFGLLTAAGSLLWDGAWAGIGYGVGTHWHTIVSAFSDIGYVLAVLALGAVALAAHHRYTSYKEATSGDQASGLAPAVSVPGHLEAATSTVADRGAPSGFLSSAAEAGPATVRISSSRDRLPAREADFPRSPITAWEAAVRRARQAEVGDGQPLLEREDEGVEANGRLTAMLGALLILLLAIEGISIVKIHTLALLTVHVVIGMVLVPVVVLKIGSTAWRFARYYLGSSEYRRKGPPPTVLRLLGPFVVVTTVAVVASGIALLLAPVHLRNELLFIHRATFILWFAAMVVHVLGHLVDVASLAPRDFYKRTRRQVRGAGARVWAILAGVCVGILLAVALTPKIGPWFTQYQSVRHKPVGAYTTSIPTGVPGGHS